MNPHTASDQRYFDSLSRGDVTWTGPGTSVTALLSPDGSFVTHRVYDGVHETYVSDRADAIATSRRRTR